MTVGLPGAGILGTSGVVKLTSKDGSLSVTPTRGTGFVDLSVAGAGSAFWQESLPDYLNPTPDGCGNNKSVRTWNYECSPNNQSFFSMYDCTRCHDICMGLPSTFNCEVDRMAFYNSSGAQIESDVNWWSRCDGSCLNGGDVLTWDASYNAWVGAPDCDNGYTG